jgi:hypothetical protein
MKTTTILAALLPILSVSADLKGVYINATTSGINNPTGGYKIILNNIGSINAYDNLAVTRLQLVQDQPQGILADDVECRAYKDVAGYIPGSLPFSGSTRADLATNTVTVGSILCYAIKALPN